MASFADILNIIWGYYR